MRAPAIRRAGFALLPVVLMLGLLAAVALVMTHEGAMSGELARSAAQTDEARYVAEAGLRHAKWKAQQSGCSGYANLSGTPFGTHSYAASFAQTSGSPVQVLAKAALAGGGAGQVIRDVRVFEPPVPASVQPGPTDGKDTWITSTQPSWNYGAHGSLKANQGAEQRSLLEFALPTLPAAATILSAQLELYATGVSAVGAVDVHRLTQTWDEGSCSGTGGCSSAASWSKRKQTLLLGYWNSPGGDHASAPAASRVVDSQDSWFQWELTALVSAWYSGAEDNEGILLRAQPGANATFASSDGADASLRPRLTVVYACECNAPCGTASAAGLWLSTADDVASSGAPGLDAWTDGEALSLADPNLSLEPATDGTFYPILNLDDFAADADADLDAIHYVDRDITVGSANSVALLSGDVLLSTAQNETLTSTNSLSVNDEDVFAFRPDTPGDHSAGTFIFLLDGSQIHGESDTVGVSLVEADTAVGDGSLAKGSFIMAVTNRRDVIEFTADDVGPGTTSGGFNEFIDGPDLSFGSEIRGLDLAEEALDLGGHAIPAGAILVTLNDDDGGVGDNGVPADSADVFYLTVTQTGASSVADATLLFEGADVGLDSDPEHLQALTLTDAPSGGGAPPSIVLATESGATLGGLTFTDKDLAEYDPDAETASLFLDGSMVGLGSDIDAAHVLASGHLVLSTIGSASLGGISFENEDLVDYDPVADTATLLFDGSALFTGGSTDVSAVHVLANGHLLLTNEYSATLGGQDHESNDVLDYDPASDTATLLLDGDSVGLTAWIDAVHRLANGHLVLSTATSATLGGLSFEDGDLVEYDLASDTATLYFDEDLFSANENVRAAHVGGGSGAVPGTGPIAHWKLDDGSGPTAVDASGFGHDGTLAGNPTWGTGELDGALDFDGSGDRVDADPLLTGGSAEITVTAWVYKRDSGDDRVVCKSSGTAIPDHVFCLGVANTTIRARLRTTDNGGASNYDGGAIALNEWVHLAFTYDGTTLRVYRDGAETASHPVTGDMIASSRTTAIGNVNASADRYWNGLLDDVRVYDRALGAAEIAGLASGGGGGGGGGGPTVFEVRVAAGNDDGEERSGDGNMYLTSSDLELANDGSTSDTVGMRFTNVTIPPGAAIASAYVQFQVDETDSGAVSLTIEGQDADDAAGFSSSDFDITSRPRTTASVAWSPPPWTSVGDAGPDQQTPDLAALIQEIVDRPGWASGNDLVLVVTGSGTRTAESYNGSSSAAPLLHVEY